MYFSVYYIAISLRMDESISFIHHLHPLDIINSNLAMLPASAMVLLVENRVLTFFPFSKQTPFSINLYFGYNGISCHVKPKSI